MGNETNDMIKEQLCTEFKWNIEKNEKKQNDKYYDS